MVYHGVQMQSTPSPSAAAESLSLFGYRDDRDIDGQFILGKTQPDLIPRRQSLVTLTDSRSLISP